MECAPRYVPPEYIAVVYAGMGDKDNAFQRLDTAIDQRSMQSWVYPDSRIDSLRSNPASKRSPAEDRKSVV